MNSATLQVTIEIPLSLVKAAKAVLVSNSFTVINEEALARVLAQFIVDNFGCGPNTGTLHRDEDMKQLMTDEVDNGGELLEMLVDEKIVTRNAENT